jgi:hypothetical protein
MVLKSLYLNYHAEIKEYGTCPYSVKVSSWNES